jgi:hypothetical protein
VPLPKPRGNESRDTFISRCMSESDLPLANNQRIAACEDAWRRRGKEDMTARGAVRIRHSPWHPEEDE